MAVTREPLGSSAVAPARIMASLADGSQTAAYVAAYDLRTTSVRVVNLPQPRPLSAWCRSAGVSDAIVGGFFVRASGQPLGELRIGGIRRASVPFDAPWHERRACVHLEGARLRIARRPDVPAAPRGDLLQAGPLLVHEGRVVVVDGLDPEGFSAGRRQFDSDITAGRHPRAALGVGQGVAWAVACDGRSDEDAGMTLRELAEFVAALGVETAINLDGGGSTSLVLGGELVNRPRDHHGAASHDGRPVRTALAFVRH